MKIFISHSSEDNAFAANLAEKLSAQGFDVWIDFAGLQAGSNLPTQINDALGLCDVLILLWSKSASLSRWVKEEWTAAFHEGKAVIPCCADETELPTILRKELYIEFKSFEDGYNKLCSALVTFVNNSEPTPGQKVNGQIPQQPRTGMVINCTAYHPFRRDWIIPPQCIVDNSPPVKLKWNKLVFVSLGPYKPHDIIIYFKDPVFRVREGVVKFEVTVLPGEVKQYSYKPPWTFLGHGKIERIL